MRSLHHYVAEQRFAEYRAVADVSGRQEVDGSIPFVSTISILSTFLPFGHQSISHRFRSLFVCLAQDIFVCFRRESTDNETIADVPLRIVVIRGVF